MGFSSFPNGFAGGVLLKEVPVSIPHPGKVFWVNNSTVLAEGGIGGSDGNPGTYRQPFSTLDYAIGKCLANRGDVIYIMPGYTQSMTAADAVDVDVAGVTIIGLGRGTKRAKFTYDNAAGEFVIGADNVHIENLWFVPSVTGITHALHVETLSDDVEIVNCRFGDPEAIGIDEFLISIDIAVTCLRPTISGCFIDGGEAGAASGIDITTPNTAYILDNTIIGDFSTACLACSTGAGIGSTLVGRNVLINGVLSGLNTVAAITQVAATNLVLFDNYIASDVATFALMITNATSDFNLGNRYTDDIGAASTAVDRSASVTVSADA